MKKTPLKKRETARVVLATLSAAAGGTASYTLTLQTQNNPTNADLSLSVSGVPGGATAAFTPATINTGTGSSTLNVSAPAGAVAPGTYNCC